MKKSNNKVFRYALIVIAVGSCLLIASLSNAKSKDPRFPPVKIKNGKLYAGDEELFLNAVGYSGIRPGKDHTYDFNDEKYGYDLIDHDMKMIKEAGFNAIRTYALLDEKLVELAQKHGLWLVAAIWTDQNIDLNNDALIEQQLIRVKEQMTIYRRYPNVAMILLINEPNPGLMFSEPSKDYLKKLAAQGRKYAKGIPITFSNMPNAVFIDPEPWDLISYNIYAAAYPKFQSSIGYRGLVEGIRKLGAGDKPYFISEYGFYSPVPEPQMDEPWIFFYVEDEKTQAKKLLRDQQTLLPLNLAGSTLMMWADDWRVFAEVPIAQPFLKDPKRNKDIHDMFTQEWSGLLALDDDILGKPRQAYFDLQRVNQALVLEPDAQTIYTDSFPIRIYVTEQVQNILATLDGLSAFAIPRTSAHWCQMSFPVMSSQNERKRHQLNIKVYGHDGKLIYQLNRQFWTGPPPSLPNITIEKQGTDLVPEYEITLKDGAGQPIPDADVTWGMLEVFSWKDFGGKVKTDKGGKAQVTAPQAGVFLVGAGFDYQDGKYGKKITDLIFSR